jgi:hypothetical protein
MNQSDYDIRKQFLEDLKQLAKSEHEELFRIIKTNNIEYSENSNGIFFDLVALPNDVFEKCLELMALCKKQQHDEKARTLEMDSLREETSK